MSGSKEKLSKIKYLLPLFHFVLSFVYEQAILIFADDGSSLTTVAKADFISLGAERVIGYIISKIFAGVIIFLFWSLIFYIIKNIKKVREIKFFLIIFAVLLVFLLFMWPDSFFRSIDNLVTYSDALRFYPDYWHSAYTSFIYCAGLMFFPMPFSISFLQCVFFVFDLAYIFIRIRKIFPEKKAAPFLVFALFLIPECFILMSDPYRTEIYALTCIFAVSKVLLDTLSGKENKTKDLVLLCVLMAFISIWRSEGIILGLFMLLFIVIREWKQGVKKLVPFILSFVISFTAFYIPQKIGDMKYYGSDYSIINSFAVLHNTLNREDSNLSYEGCEADMAAIEKVVPIEALRLYGIEGYRRNNVLSDHPDINQSITSFEEGKAYTKAFRNITLHNPKAYLLTQIGMLKTAFKLTDRDYIEKIHGNMPLSREYPDYVYMPWESGREDLFSAPGVNVWYNNELRTKIRSLFETVRVGVDGFCRKAYISTLILVAISLFGVFILIKEAVSFFGGIRKKKEKKEIITSFTFAYFALALLIQALAIALVMPAGVTSYFRTFFVCTFVLDILFIAVKSTQKEKTDNENCTLPDNLE